MAFLFLSLAKDNRSRTLNYFHGLRSLGIDVTWYQFSSVKDFLKSRKPIKDLLLQGRVPVIASPSHLLAIMVFLVFRKRPILEAGWPLIDGAVLSRREFGPFGLRAFLVYLIDFLSFQCSSLIFLESVNQISRVSRLYCVSKKRMRVLMTGVDESRFRNMGSLIPSRRADDFQGFEVLFRGGPQSESGLTTVKCLLQSRDLDSSIFINIISPHFQRSGREVVKFRVSSSLVGDEEIKNAFDSANLVIGQISRHRRLRYTVPHRFYESAFFGRPYLTGPLPDLGSPLPLEALIILSSESVVDVTHELNLACNSKLELVDKGAKLNAWYKSNCTQLILAKRFHNCVKEFYSFGNALNDLASDP